MKYATINIQGNLLSEEILNKIETGEAIGQKAIDFGFEPTSLRSEIEYAWSRIKLDWKHFYDKTQNLPASDPYGTNLTRRWMEQFFSSLGFTLSRQRNNLMGSNNQGYAISHTANNADDLPIHIVGFFAPDKPDKNTLDMRSSGGTSRLSPHATVQEYLNVSEHLFGLTTNGITLRLIRDSGRLIKLTYVEFDLKRMLDEDKYSEFTLLYRLLHASRFPHAKTDAEQCLLEKYYQESIETGNRIRSGLSQSVKECLVALGNGLLNQPENDALRNALQNKQLNAHELNHQLLRLIYRLLFLIVTEERNLIYDNSHTDNELKRKKDIYYRYYSLARLRKLSGKPYLFEPQFTDLWLGLLQTFSFFEPGYHGSKLGIKPLGGELFQAAAINHIRTAVINNRVLLQCIRSLNEFEDAKKNRVLINFRSLDVEELGSIYEGLLELSPVITTDGQRYRFYYEKGAERSSSGSHYTPEDLVKPLMLHSLEYLIQDRVQPYYKGKITAQTAVQNLLNLKVADVACGSGHILLSAARRLAHEVARIESGEQQPNPQSFRKALKQVICHCIYGVDKNPLAVELCKVALWLESHNPGEPLNFLDHHIKCGDAIVGLAHRSQLENGIPNEAFKTLPGDDKAIAAAWLNRNKKEREKNTATKAGQQLTTTAPIENTVQETMQEYKTFSQLPETTPLDIERKAKAYQKFLQGKGYAFLKALADTQIAQFFIPKTTANKDYLITDADFRLILTGYMGWQDIKVAKATAVAHEHKFFHWFLEFPQVFQHGGFDCVLGNPPFLGGQKLSGSFGEAYLECIKYQFAPIGAVDLVTYFFRRIFAIIKPQGFLSLISTNTIAQGKARQDGLDIIVQQGGTINFAIKSTKWPGQAAVEVALVTLTKQAWKGKFYLGNKEVKNITPYLDDALTPGNPYPLKQNEGKSFQGSIVLGKGFILEPHQAQALIAKDPRNKDVLFPYLNGDDLNNNPNQSPSRWVINFFDFTQQKAQSYPDCYQIVEQLVKPERQKLEEKKNATNKNRKEKWWLYGSDAKTLYQTIAPLERVLVVAQVSKTSAFTFTTTDKVLDAKLNVFALLKYSNFLILQSNFHIQWAWKFSSTMKSDLSYAPSMVFETFPFPQEINSHLEQALEQVGAVYHEHRRQLMLGMQLGLTKTYNAFHAEKITAGNEKWGALLAELDGGKSLQDVAINTYGFDKESLNLIKHFQKGEPSITLSQAVAGIEQLRSLHIQMDQTVLQAYGWEDIPLRHNFYEVDYLPENDRIRFTIHPHARKEILKRLLELNHKIHAQEVAAGLWDKKSKTAKKQTDQIYEVQEPMPGYGNLFGEHLK